MTLAAVREGTVFASGTVDVRNTALADGYSEKLNVSLDGATGDATVASGTLNLLAAGSANSTTLRVSLDGTATAGAKTGTVLANYASDGTGTSGLSALIGGSQAFTVTGNVYRLASLALGASVVDLGRVRLGAASFGGGTLFFGNAGLTDGYSDNLQVSTTAQGPLSLLGGAGTFAAGTGGVLSVNYTGSDMTSAGLKAGTLSFSLVSRGQTGSGLSPFTLAAQTAQVQGFVYNGQGVWGGSASGSWTDWNQWSVAGGRPGLDGAASIAAGDTASFVAAAAGITVALPGDGTTLNLAALTLGGSGSISLLGGGTIAFTGTIGSVYAGSLGVVASGGTHALDANIFLPKETAFTVAGGASLTLSGRVSGSGAAAGLVKEGAGNLTLQQGLNDLGVVKINAGILEARAEGVGQSLSLAPGAVSNAATVTIAFPASLLVSGNQQIAGLLGSGTLNLQSGTFAIQSSSDLFFSGKISGSDGTLVKAGSATLTLAGINTYSGATTLVEGTLLLMGSSANQSAISLNGGATLAGAGATAGNVTVAAGGILSPGNAEAPGKLTLGGLTLTGGAELNFRLNSTFNSDGILVSNPNGLSLSGTNTIKLSLAQGVNLPATGSYTLLSFNGSNAPTAGLVLADTKFGQYDASLVWASNSVSLLLTRGVSRQPDRVVFAEGETVFFTLGSLPVGTSVQWFRNGQVIPNAVSAAFVIPSLAAADDGMYEAQITQGSQVSLVSCGSVSVVSIAQQPAGRSIAEGGSYTFSVGTAGSAPLAYQWLHNGSLVADGTSASLQVVSVDALSTGTYQVEVRSGTLVVSSAPARLQMLPVITSSLTATAKVGDVFQYQITAANTPKKFGVLSLPAGLAVNELTGTVSGVPVAAGTVSLVLTASNAVEPDVSAGSATLNVTVLPQAPTINNTLNAFAVVGGTFSYQVTTAANNATGFGAAGLPAGLSINAATGLISGTPSAQTLLGGTIVTVTASNAGGVGTAPIVFVVSPPKPVFSSPLTVQAILGGTFSYPIVAENASGYIAKNLPPGIRFSYDTGLLSGTFPALGSYVIGLEAYNGGGSSTADLAVTVVPAPPVIGGALALSAQIGARFVYGITASNNPTHYEVTGLPVGLSLDKDKGLLSGTLTGSGSLTLALQATNAGGTGTANLVLTLTPQPVAPVLSGVLNLTVPAGVPFNYAIQASNSPKTYSAAPLPAGLALNASTGVITGVPTVPGLYAVTLGAANSLPGAGVVLSLKVVPQAPVIGSELTATAAAGAAFRYQISATNQPTKYASTALPLGLSLNTATGLVSGTPIAAGSAAITFSASNEGGSGNATLALTVLPPAPTFANDLTALATAGVAFSYQLEVLKGTVTDYRAQGLPDGLAIYPGGLISGTTAAVGVKTVLVSASNASGTTTSFLTLTVAPSLPQFTLNPAASLVANWGETPQLVASATGIPAPTYQWKRNGEVLTAGGTSATFRLPASTQVGVERYTVVATNSAGSVESTTSVVEHRPFTVNAPTLLVAGSLGAGAPRGLLPGKPFTLSASFAAAATPDAAYKWYRNGTLISGATGATYGKSAASTSDIGRYRVSVSLAGVLVPSPELSVEQGTPILRVDPPGAIAFQRSSQRFTASVVNSEFLGNPTVEYVWKRAGTEYPSGAVLNLQEITRNDAGVYDVEARVAGYGTVYDRAVLQVPTLEIVTQPIGVTALEGRVVTLSASAAISGGSLSYAWRRNGSLVVSAAGFSGINASTLTLGSFTAAQAGVYDVVVASVVGGTSLSVVSSPAPVNALVPVKLDGALFAKQTRSIRTGQPLGLEVSILEGTGPFVYQWYRVIDGVDVALTDGLTGKQIVNGARSARLLMTPLDKEEKLMGSYKVMVSNGSYAQAASPAWVGGASVTSAPVVISELLAPPAGLAVQPSVNGPYELGATPTLTVSGLTNPGAYRFQWRRNGLPVANAAALSGSYTLSIDKADQAASYDAVVSNDAGSSIAAAYVVALRKAPATLLTPLLPVTILEGQRLEWNSFSVSGDDLVKLWTRVSPLPVRSGSLVGGALVIASVGTLDSGTYTFKASNSTSEVTSTATLRVLQKVSILVSPVAGALLTPGESRLFTVKAAGGDLSLSGGALKYQWLKNGQVIPGANDSEYRLAAASDSDDKISLAARVYIQDPFTGVVLNSAVSSPAVLAVRQPVQILAQPENLTADLNTTIVLAVSATGSELSYQWRKNGVAISGGTQATLVLKVSESTAGSYDVSVGNRINSITSNAAKVDVRIPARITLQPVSKAVNAGRSVQFQVEAAGTDPLTYQWRKDGKALVANGTFSGVSSATLAIARADLSLEGTYDVVVSNRIGNPEVSFPASLSFISTLEIISQPIAQTLRSGEPVSLSVSARGTTGLRYQWRRNGVALPGATYPVLALSQASAAQSGDYDVVVSSGRLDVASEAARVAIYDPVRLVENPQAVINLLPANEAAPYATAQLRAIATGGGVKTWEWYKNGQLLPPGAGGFTNVYNVTADDYPASYHVVVRSSVALASGTLDLGTATSPAVQVSLLEKVRVVSIPSGVVANNGGSASLTVSAQGGGQLSYQWERERGGRWNALAGATTGTLSLSGLRSSDAGGYRVTVSNARGSVTSTAASVAVRDIDVILQQPASLVVNPGNAAVFEVVAAGTGLTYQWRKDGRALAGQVEARLSLASVKEADAGAYDVVVTQVYGSSISNAARLAVNQAPSITVSPASTAVVSGNRATLTVRATGTETLHYKWRRNGIVLGSAPDKAFYMIENAKDADTGVYDVLVENVAGSQTSSSAVVNIMNGVNILQHPITQTSTPGQTVRLSVLATGSPMLSTASLGYRWRKDGVDLVDESNRVSGSQSETLVLSKVEGASAFSKGSNGKYDVVVYNEINERVSLPASLTVHSAPNILAHPQSLAVNKGDVARFSVTLDDLSAAKFQWYRRGVGQSVGSVVSNGSQREFVIPKVDITRDSGTYWVVASNEFGESTSREVSLSELNISVPNELAQAGANGGVLGDAQPGTALPPRKVECARGDAVELRFTASLTAQEGVAYAFQWRLNGSALSDGPRFNGTNTSTLSIPKAADADSGIYDLVVTAVSGGAEKARFTVRTTQLSVLQPPVVNGLADVLARPGQPVVFAPVVVPAKAGAALVYQWFFNGERLVNEAAPTLTIPAAAAGDAGVYKFVVTDVVYGVREVEAKLSVSVPLNVTALPAVLEVESRSMASIAVVASGNASDGVIRYQWRFNGTPIRGAVASKLVLASVLTSQMGVYDVVVSNNFERVVSSPCTLKAREPWRFITQPAASTTVNPDEPVNLSFALNRIESTSIQWYRGLGRSVQVVSGQTGVTLSLAKAQPSDDAFYFAVVTTPLGRMVTTASRLLVNRKVSFTQQPQSRALNPGAPVTFAAAAEGTGPLSFQWLRNGSPVPGANKLTLTLASVVAADSGSYQLQVRNPVSVNGVLSNAAELVVSAPPVIVNGPADLKLLEGGTASFSVEVSGGGTLSYQWRRNGIDISGAVAAVYTRANVSVFDTGVFDCLVTKKDGAQNIGSTVSRHALLQVSEPVQIVAVPASRSAATTGDTNRSAAFKVIASGSGPLVYTWTKVGARAADDTVLSATGDTLSWAEVTAADLGEYRVSVSGPVGAAATVEGIRLSQASNAAFILQPQSSTGFEGGTLTLTAQAAEGYTISKWQKIGADVTTGSLTITDVASGMHSGSLSFGTLSTADTAYYRAVALSAGSVEVVSDSALVFVNSARALYKAGFLDGSVSGELLKLTQTILANEGEDINLALSTQGEGLAFDWAKEGALLPSTVLGKNTATLSLLAIAPEDAGIYTATVKIPKGDGTFVQEQSAPWTLVVRALPKILAQPIEPAPVKPGDKSLFSVAASVTGDTSFQWFFRRTGTPLWVPVPGATVGSGTGSTCVLDSVQKTDEGDYRVELSNAAGTVVSEKASLRVMDPVSVTLTGNAVVNPGGTLTLTAATTGDLQEPHVFTFYRQLRTTGSWVALPVQSSGTLVIEPVSEAHQTAYKVRVYGKVNNAVDSVPVSVVVNDPVVFAAGTALKTVALTQGESALFKVAALGSDVHYQWYFKALNAGTWTTVTAGTANAAYTPDAYYIRSIMPGDAGSYGVRISNSFSQVPATGQEPMAIARLSVNTPPAVTIVSPQGLVQSAVGSTFGVSARVNDTLAGLVNYQWRKNGIAISGASGSVWVGGAGVTLQFGPKVLSLLDAGYYDVLVSNAFGSTLSASVPLVVYPNPVVVKQPESALGSVGGTATFRAEVTGAGSLTFAWEKLSGGTWSTLENGTQPVLTLKGISTLNSGSYRVQIGSDYGNTVSSVVTLGVSSPENLKFETEPALVSGNANTLVAGTSGLQLSTRVSDASNSTSVSYRWRKDGVDLASGAGTASRSVAGGSYTITYALPPVANDTDGAYDVIVSNGATFAGSPGVTLVVDPKIEAFEVPETVTPGDAVKLSVSVRNASSGNYAYTWYRNGNPVSEGTLYSGTLTSELTLKAAPESWTTASLFKVRVRNTVTNAVMESGTRSLSVLARVSITTQPTAVSLDEGNAFGLNVIATGGGELSYQWLRDGVELPEETRPLLTRGTAVAADGGLYQVRVSNAAGVAYSDVAAVNVRTKLGVEIATPDPVPLGGAVNLLARVSGMRSSSDVLEYQWTLNGKGLVNTGTDQYRISSASLMDGGLYALTVTRQATGEKVTSRPVLLDIKRVPVVIVAPVSRGVVGGAISSVNFTVVVSSDTPVTYQWSKDGVAISKANAAGYRIVNAGTAQAGQYTVRITNAAGSVEASARLSVLNAGSTLTPGVTAGSTGTIFARASWWVYWVEATAALSAADRNGYWLLERQALTTSGTTTVTPGRSLWVWGSAANLVQAPVVYEWDAASQVVQDGVASERNEFSVVADRLPAASFTLSGKLEGVGDAALYGAPEVIKGAYNGDTEPLAVSLAWDSEQVENFRDIGSPASLREMEEMLKQSLQRELATIAGE